MHRFGFDAALGTASVDYVDNTLLIDKSVGTHSLQLTLSVQTPQPETAGRLMILQTNLFTTWTNGNRAWLGSAVHHLPFIPGNIHRATLRYLLTSAQVIALEQNRSGDLQLQMEIDAALP